MIQLSCQDLAAGYEGKTVVAGLTFAVDSSDYLVIVGENGSGKSTLMRTLLNLQKPVSGKVQLGAGVSRYDMGYLPQQTAVQKDFPASVWEVVISGCMAHSGLHPFYTAADKALAEKNMDIAGVGNLRHKSFQQLSGGQRQRVLFARALCAARKILFLDEPLSGLDPEAAASMYETVQLHNSRGLAIIMISHDISVALRYASHILYLGDNQFYGTREEYTVWQKCLRK